MTSFYKASFLKGAPFILCLLLSTFVSAQREISPFSTTLEAECADVIGSEWSMVTDSAASSRSYLTSTGTVINAATPPTDTASHISFTVDIPDANTFYMFARVNGVNTSADSYWVRVNGGDWIKWDSGFGTKGVFGYARVPGGPFALPSGETEIEFAIREPNTRLDKITLTSVDALPTGIGPRGDNCDGPVDCEQFPETCKTAFTLEAECGQSGNGWQAIRNDNASNRIYLSYSGQPQLTTPANNPVFERELQFKVDLSEEGDYTMFLRMNTPDNGKNSFWVRVDRQAWVEFVNETDGNQLRTNGFEWRPVTAGSTVKVFTLPAGKHVISVVNREPGAQIDKAYIAKEATAPTGKGEIGDNCRVDQITGVRPDIDLSSRMDVYPNPANRLLNFSLSNSSRGPVAVKVYDLNGRLLTERRLEKSGETLSDAIEVSDFASGVYQLVLITDAGLISRTFVR